MRIEAKGPIPILVWTRAGTFSFIIVVEFEKMGTHDMIGKQSTARRKTVGISYTYDDNGNVISMDDNGDVTSYEYDIENYQTKVILPNTDEYDYLICPLGLRIAKTTPSTTEYYGYDRKNRLMKYDSNGNTVSKYAQNPSSIDETLS